MKTWIKRLFHESPEIAFPMALIFLVMAAMVVIALTTFLWL